MPRTKKKEYTTTRISRLNIYNASCTIKQLHLLRRKQDQEHPSPVEPRARKDPVRRQLASMNDADGSSNEARKTEGEMEQEKSSLVCPIAKNAALLEELDVAEEKVAELLEVAAGAVDELAGVESLDNAKVEASTKQFLGLVATVHGCLASKASLIRDYTPYPRSIYGPRKELELLQEKARFLRSELDSMASEAPTATSPAPAAADPSAPSSISLEGVGASSDLPADEGKGDTDVAATPVVS